MNAARLFLLLLALVSGCVHARPTGAVPPATQTVLTADGYPIAIHHYPVPEPGPDATPLPLRARPVILSHGVATNHRCLDLIEGGSLARHLAEQGFDVWSLDLRGHGDSRDPPKGVSRSQRSFDHYVLHDVPAAVRYVRNQTGADGVAWVGHSMGGMVAYAYLGAGGEGIDALVAIASPGSMRQHGLLRLAAEMGPAFALLPQVYGRCYGKFHAAVFRGWSPFYLDNLVYNRRNLTAEERKLLAATALENISRAEVKSFSSWSTRDRFCSDDGKVDYVAGFARITVPVLLLSGTADRIVPPANVQFVMGRLGSADKTHRVFGRLSGDAHDWGHVDLVAGELADAEVFPEIAAWLEARDPSSCAPQIASDPQFQ